MQHWQVVCQRKEGSSCTGRQGMENRVAMSFPPFELFCLEEEQRLNGSRPVRDSVAPARTSSGVPEAAEAVTEPWFDSWYDDSRRTAKAISKACRVLSSVGCQACRPGCEYSHPDWILWAKTNECKNPLPFSMLNMLLSR